MNTSRLTHAQNNPEYWDGLKYYLRVDLEDAWSENDALYWAWAVQCAQTHTRARRLVDYFLQEIAFERVDEIFRYFDLCEQCGFDIDKNILGRVSKFPVAVVEHIVQKLSDEQLKDCGTYAVYCAIRSKNTDVLTYFDTLFDFEVIRAKFQYLSDQGPEYMEMYAQVLDPYILNKTLTQVTDGYGSPQGAKKM